MAASIARQSNGVIKLVQDGTVTWFINPQNVVVTNKWGNSICIDYIGNTYYNIPYPSLDTINGAPAPADIAQQTLLIATTVLNPTP